ncbi:MAG: hypothetical protein ACI8ZF_000563 [Candidatus Midichloriaceae bacterium]|jgi:uncharacterized protein (UPF0147 family)
MNIFDINDNKTEPNNNKLVEEYVDKMLKCLDKLLQDSHNVYYTKAYVAKALSKLDFKTLSEKHLNEALKFFDTFLNGDIKEDEVLELCIAPYTQGLSVEGSDKILELVEKLLQGDSWCYTKEYAVGTLANLSGNLSVEASDKILELVARILQGEKITDETKEFAAVVLCRLILNKKLSREALDETLELVYTLLNSNPTNNTKDTVKYMASNLITTMNDLDKGLKLLYKIMQDKDDMPSIKNGIKILLDLSENKLSGETLDTVLEFLDKLVNDSTILLYVRRAGVADVLSNLLKENLSDEALDKILKLSYTLMTKKIIYYVGGSKENELSYEYTKKYLLNTLFNLAKKYPDKTLELLEKLLHDKPIDEMKEFVSEALFGLIRYNKLFGKHSNEVLNLFKEIMKDKPTDKMKEFVSEALAHLSGNNIIPEKYYDTMLECLYKVFQGDSYKIVDGVMEALSNLIRIWGSFR